MYGQTREFFSSRLAAVQIAGHRERGEGIDKTIKCSLDSLSVHIRTPRKRVHAFDQKGIWHTAGAIKARAGNKAMKREGEGEVNLSIASLAMAKIQRQIADR